jgi:NADPH:quinone reductase-like Zn-dependent oxidoreductase
MKAYEIRDTFGVDALAVSDRADPKPGPGQVVVNTRAVSLNFRDLLVVKGDYSRKLPLPMTPCSDCAGEVAAIGDGVTRVKVGDRVAGIFMQTWIDGEVTEAKAKSALGGAIGGVLAEQVLLHESGLVHLPAHLSFEEGATLPCAAVTAWHALIDEGALKPGDTVVTLGSGGVSLFALQFAKLAGARVISTSSSDEKLARLCGLGASDGVNYKTTPDWDKRVRELTGAGADHIVEVGGASTLAKSLKAVRMGGRISLIGNVAGGGEVNPVPLLMKNVRMQGIFVGSREMFEAMNRAIAKHSLRPVVDRVFPFDQAREAMRYMESGAHFGKVCIACGTG